MIRRLFSIGLFAALLVVVATAPSAAVEVKKVISPKGIEAWLVEDHINPIISLRFAFRGGAALDPKGKEGLAKMVSSTIDEGAGDLDSQTFQGRLEDLSIGLGFSAGRDTFGGSLKTLTKNRDIAFKLLGLAITKPRFDKEPVERIRGQIMVGLKRASEDPGSIARLTIMRTMFPDAPYGRPVKGTQESVRAITASDLRKFVHDRLALDNLVIGVVGDIKAGELARLLDRTFGKLPARATPWKIAEVKPQTNGKTIIVTKNVPQSTILFADRGIKRSAPDFYAAYVMNHIMGSGFTSRLYSEVREKRGLAYSVYSYLYPLDYSAMIMGGAGTANASVAETLKVVRKEWRKFAKKGVGQKELDDAKTYLTGSFPLRFTSSGNIASILVGMQLDDLGIDYLDKRNSMIDAVTRDDVNRVAKKLLDADRLTFVVVGKPEGLKQNDSPD